ncbi:unnamed protein product [Hymenolepis diminuta]|uniref:Uncharacterized protein n=1 Tax=Hymenolepis diminuta TaxID=6216 RepID=A0A564YLJ4_HYMDI|nr:unnamed protein product [Hymenolepis diminuta]
MPSLLIDLLTKQALYKNMKISILFFEIYQELILKLRLPNATYWTFSIIWT